MEEIQTLYSTIFPDSRIKLNNEDWASCNIGIESDDSKRICEYLEQVNNRIDISKSSSLQTSELFTNRLIKQLRPYHKDIYGVIEPFCDGREQGLIVSLFNQKTDDPLYIWTCEDKTNKDLMIITSKDKNNVNQYLADDLEKAQYFSRTNYDEALNYCLSQIDLFLDKNLNFKI